MANEINPHNLMVQMRAMAARAQGVETVQPSATEDFTQLLRSAIERVNTNQQHAGKMTAAFERGEDVSLGDVMVSVQKANVSFQAALHVRNRLVAAYQDVMNMPI